MHKQPSAPRRAVVYCVVPEDLAVRLHEPLRRHFADLSTVEVVVEQRWRDRRRSADRRADEPAAVEAERRTIRARSGRRVDERRASVAIVEAPRELPRKARPYAERIVFLERLEPTTEQLEDRDTARLVTRFQAGDRDVFSVLYMRYFDRVYSYLRVAVKDAHTAEDLAQQVFISVLDALPRYERRGRPFRAWLFVIVRNHAINQLRRDRRAEPVEPELLDRRRDEADDMEIDLRALEWVSDRELVMLMSRLPAIQQQVLLLRFQLDMGTSEIAEILGRTCDDVRGLQSRALRFLSARLTALGRGPATQRRPARARLYPKYAPVLRGRRFALR